MKISAIVLTKNSQRVIKDCLESLDWVDEIVVVDDNSTDKTLDIVNGYKNTMAVVAKGSFSDKRNLGLKKTMGEWVLYVDSDERVTPALRREINEKLKEEGASYAIPRRNFVFGKEMKRVGLWPDYVKRLFRRENFAKWEGRLHEEPIFEGKLEHLTNPLIHIKHDNLSDMVEKTNEWSEIEAELMFKHDHPKMNILRFLSAGFREFWLRMVVQLAFLDGARGIIYAMYQVYSRLISYAKLWELQIKNESGDL